MNNQLTIIDKKEVVITDESSLEKIKKAFLEQVEITKNVVVKNPFDTEELAAVKKVRKSYVTNRETVKRVFKADRDVHTEYNRKNMAAQNEILILLEGEENRLTDVITRAELEAAKEERRKLLPFRKDELSKFNSVVPDEELLALNDADFERLLALKKEHFLELEAKRLEREKMLEEARAQAEKEKQAAIEAERDKARLAAEKAERDRLDELAKLERERLLAIEKAEEEKRRAIEAEASRVQKIADDKAAAEKAIRDAEEARKKKEEEDKIAAQNRIDEETRQAAIKAEVNTFLVSNNYDKETMEFRNCGGGVFELWSKPQKLASITITK